MKKLLCMLALLVSVTIVAQQKPKEVKQETKVKTVKINDGESVSEKKVEVVTREETDVNLDANDEQKVNQGRSKTDTKVEKTVTVSNDGYQTSSKVTYYKLDGAKYQFTPNASGFDIAADNDNKEYKKVGTAWISGTKKHYIVNEDMFNGIGYFDNEGNLVFEYYNKDKNQIESKTYNLEK